MPHLPLSQLSFEGDRWSKTGVVKKSLPSVHYKTRLASWFKNTVRPTPFMSNHVKWATGQEVRKRYEIRHDMSDFSEHVDEYKKPKQPSKTIKLIFWTNSRQVTKMGVVKKLDSSNFLKLWKLGEEWKTWVVKKMLKKSRTPFLFFYRWRFAKSRQSKTIVLLLMNWAEDSCP